MILLLFSSCENSFSWLYKLFSEEYHINFDKEAYEAAKEKWQALNCDKYSYSYKIYADWGPSPIVKVTIVDGLASHQLESEYEDDEEALSLEESEKFFSAESLFERIYQAYQEALETGENPPEGLISENITVSYDEESGIPVRIEIDSSWDESRDGGWWNMDIKDITLE